MGHTHDDSFFTNAQPGLARFRSDVAVEVLRAFADQAVTRAQPEFRQAVFLLAHHTVALDDRVAALYVEKAHEIANAVLDAGQDKNNEAWVQAQYALSVAFPHMAGDAQFDALVTHPKGTILMALCYLFQPVETNRLARGLNKALQECNTDAQFRILCFAEYSQTPLTARTKELVLGLLVSQERLVRLSALSLIRATADPVLLTGLVKSGWSAALLDSVSDKMEIFHGSQALVLAAEQGMITLEACLARIALSAYENLAERLGADAAMEIAGRLTMAIHRAAEFQITTSLPEIEQSFDGYDWPVVLHISEKQADNETLQAQFHRFSETGDAWYERQKRSQEATVQFERDLTKAGAQIIIQSVTVGLIANIDEVTPALVDSWYAFFLKLDNKSLNNVHNIAYVVAEVISKRDALAALTLFKMLRTTSPHVRVTFSQSKIDLDAVTAWEAADCVEMNALRFSRLDRIGNDHDLAMEVLAAIWANRLDVLQDYVIDRRKRPEPAHRARAVMVAGLSPDEDWAVETIEMLSNERGFLQTAYRSAKYAMERHQWSRHWAAQMRTATNPVDLWRYAVLLSKIVDGRFMASEVEGSTLNPLIKRFGTTLNAPIRNRIRKWKDKRSTKLFGMNVPNEVFLPRD